MINLLLVKWHSQFLSKKQKAYKILLDPVSKLLMTSNATVFFSNDCHCR